jgi:SAM-dependent methyltransferase
VAMESSARSERSFGGAATLPGEHGSVDEPLVSRATRALVPTRWRRALAGVRALAHRGNAVQSPCCDGSFDFFVRHRGRPHAKCPRCGALERHRLLWLYLSDRTNLLSSECSLLHFAPERAYAERLKARPGLRYVTADLDSPLAMDKVDITDMPYADGSFDAVLCNHVLEHVDDDRLAMREIRRVLRPGGWAILMTPIDGTRATTLEDPAITTPAERHRVFGQSDHVRLYGRDFATRAAEAGFAVRTDRYVDRLHPELVIRCGLRRDDDEAFREEDIFLCVASPSAGGQAAA